MTWIFRELSPPGLMNIVNTDLLFSTDEPNDHHGALVI